MRLSGGTAAVLLLTLVATAADVLVGWRSTAPYSFRDQAISDLGVTTCGPVQGQGGPVEVCSPWWPVMNAAMVVTGAALVAAGTLARRRLGAGRGAQVSLAVAGLSTVGAGLVPLDVSLTWHVLLALPAFPALAVASALLARPLAALAGPAWRPALLSCAAVTATATAAFVAPTSWDVPFGLVERVAAYLLPVLLGAFAVRMLLTRPEQVRG